MKRIDFIRGLIGVFGVAVLPRNMVHHYRRIYLLQSFIRGFRFYEGQKLLAKMKEGDILELIREPDNPHDSCAIALYFNDSKVGYVPREDNEILSRLLDAGVIDLLAEITHLKPEAAAWENVHIAVYVLKALEGSSLPKEAAYLTILDTPHYRTLKHKDNDLTRIYYNSNSEDVATEEDIYNGNDFYRELVIHSKTDEVYDLIHTGFGGPEAMEEAVKEMRLVVNRRQVPPDIAADRVIKALDDAIVELDSYFDEDGYVIANVNRLAELSPRIARFSQVLDKEGRRFFEVIFKGFPLS